MLLLDALEKRFGDVVALDGCSFEVAPGQMLGFLGPNGAGKTTAMRSVFGLVRPDGGTVTWQGHPLSQAVRRTFGYMPEERGLYPKMPVRQQVVYFGRIHGLERGEAEAAADVWLEVFDLADRTDAKVEDLSHGNQQRVQLIVALIHDPPVLVLDEPFSGLDPIAAHTMAGVLRDRAASGSAVLFSSHQLDVVEGLCEDVVIINDGKVILSGRVNHIRAESPRRYLDVVFDGPFDHRWTSNLDHIDVVDDRTDGARLLIDDRVDVAVLAATTARAGTVAQFVVEPPPLSEIFREVVAS
ncbi:MAG: ATP-binding cassette domain-containing protein [Acidimicrobiia bacterium]|nr:ATP-binding cassette domain-containing protein [Acidimicrobiia bacterium]